MTRPYRKIPVVHSPNQCVFCDNYADWHGYTVGDKIYQMCEPCKEEFVKYGQSYGITFGRHTYDDIVKDGFCLYATNRTMEEMTEFFMNYAATKVIKHYTVVGWL